MAEVRKEKILSHFAKCIVMVTLFVTFFSHSGSLFIIINRVEGTIRPNPSSSCSLTMPPVPILEYEAASISKRRRISFQSASLLSKIPRLFVKQIDGTFDDASATATHILGIVRKKARKTLFGR